MHPANSLARSFVLSGLLLLGACATPAAPVEAPTPPPAAPVDPVRKAADSISAAQVLQHIRVLASDEFEGRLPGSAGEERTVAYLTEQFRALGLQPGNPDGSYVQKVPLVGISGHPQMRLRAGGRRIVMQPGEDFVAASQHLQSRVTVKDSALVFVGYGVQAPEYQWDDYKGMDLRGKTLVMLINDPAVPDPAHPGELDPSLFKGKAMTYYGRWTYKYEIAARLGAAAAIIVHETEPAAYPWEVVRNSWGGEQFSLVSAQRNRERIAVQSWITRDKARALFKASGQDFDALKQAALSRSFRPVPLNARVSFRIDNRMREVQSRNVVARLPGRDPQLREQTILYSAHWDHFGRDNTLSGDQIFNGAADNASGVAGLLAIARAYTQLPQAPRRSTLFLAVTAEEQGLLGSAYYAQHPLYPLNQTLVDINMDVLSTWGATRDVQIVGSGQSDVEEVFTRLAQDRQRLVLPDSNPEKGSYFRSDQFAFASLGVPGLYTKAGVEVIGKPAGFGQAKREEYVARDYHKVSDEVKPDWDLAGAAQDLQLFFETGCALDQADAWPQWKPGSEFKAIRDAQLAAH